MTAVVQGDPSADPEEAAGEEALEPLEHAPLDGEGGAGPYRNLWVPLLVVPAAIVMVLVCVFLFFGVIAGRQKSLDENLSLVVSGGANERKQAAFNLAVQIADNQRATLDGEEPPWPIAPEFLPRLRIAWESADAEDLDLALLVACLQAQGGDAVGVDNLLLLVRASPEEDPEGRVRFQALAQLGALGDPRALDTLVEGLDDPDPGLRAIAAIALQRQPSEEAASALRAALGDDALEVRANAALALALRGDPAAAPTLRDLLDPELYAAEHEREKRRFARGSLVSESRVKAVEALGRLGLSEDRARIEALAEGDEDVAVRGAALRALADWPRD